MLLSGFQIHEFLSLQYLFSAERSINHEEVIVPALKRGKVVISDRSFWSAIVYGILDKTGGKYDKDSVDLLLISQSIISMYHQFITPDLTFYLKVSVKESIKRLRLKKDIKEIYEDERKIAKIFTGYSYLVERFSEEITVVNGEEAVQVVTKYMIDIINNKK